MAGKRKEKHTKKKIILLKRKQKTGLNGEKIKTSITLINLLFIWTSFHLALIYGVFVL